MSQETPRQLYPHPARLIIVLATAPAIGLGICRFAYARILPDMRDSLGLTRQCLPARADVFASAQAQLGVFR
jgi:hypothetical protein